MEYNIALVGNPNVGKTSLFNRITHSFEHVGNWHGVTVKEVAKKVIYDHKTVNMIDLPGLYSLTVYSPEEAISRDHVLSGKSDLVVTVCEVNNLSRNLYLALQLMELGVPVIIVVNMMDELKKQGKVLNYRKIEKFLKVPIVPMSAKYHSDVHLLMEVAIEQINSRRQSEDKVGQHTHSLLPYLDNLPLNIVSEILGKNVNNLTDGNATYACIKVLENDKFVLDKLKLSENQKAALSIIGDWQARVAKERYEYIDSVVEGAITKADHNNVKSKKSSTSGGNGYSRLDKVLLNKYLSIPIFLLIMLSIFALTFGVIGNFMSEWLEYGIDNFIYAPVTTALTNIEVPVWIVALVGEGIIQGVGGILTFLPQVVLLFFFLALLEDSGYISRVAFMTDGLFRKIGLSGRSVFTMLMGFGCSATAVLTARGLDDEVMRRKTVLLTPFMSCSARLPIYAVIGGAFFAGGQPLIIMGLYVLGVAVALTIAYLFEKFTKKLKSGKLSFIMEMPPYRVPTVERVFQTIWNNAKIFIVRVGTVVFALNVIVWLLSNFSFTLVYTGGAASGEELGGSILEIISGFIAPIFTPLGFGEWRAVTALLSGLVAKEVVISSIESLGGIGSIFVGNNANISAISFLVFTLLYVPCIATISAMNKEIGWKWTLAGTAMQLGVAYAVALVVRLICLLFISSIGVGVGVLIAAVVGIYCAVVLQKFISNRGSCSNCKNCASHGKCSIELNKSKNSCETTTERRAKCESETTTECNAKCEGKTTTECGASCDKQVPNNSRCDDKKSDKKEPGAKGRGD